MWIFQFNLPAFVSISKIRAAHGHQEVDEVDNATAAGFGEFTDALQVKVTAGHAQLRIQLFQDRTESELLGQVGSPGPKGPRTWGGGGCGLASGQQLT